MTEHAQSSAPRRGGITLARISRQIGAATILDDVSLEIRSGEFFSLLGPSGCGKTTLLRIVAGLVTPTGGSISVEGVDVREVPPHRRPVGMIFQHLALFPHLSVHDNVAFGLKLRRVRGTELNRRVLSALEVVSLGAFAKRRIHELSGGQQQRVAIARALVLEPSALLLDEPFGALDVQLRQRLQVELKRIQKSLGMSFLYVTHDQAEAFAMADRIGVMENGRLLQVGPPAELYRAPATQFVASFLGDANLLEGQAVSRADHNRAVVAWGAMRMVVSARTETASGAVICVVRPEHVTVGPAAAALDNSTQARVEELRFLGSRILCLLVTADGRRLRAVLDSRSPALVEDEVVTIGWNASDVALLPTQAADGMPSAGAAVGISPDTKRSRRD